MNPQKKLPLPLFLRVAIQPSDGARDNLVAASLGYGRTGVAGDRWPKTGVVYLEAAVEALCQPVPRVEINGANEGCSPLHLRLQPVRKIKQRRWQRAANRAHAGALRVGSGKNGGVRNKAGGRLGVGVFEDNALPGETIEVRRECQLGAEEAHTVGAGGVEGDQHQIGLRCGCGDRETKTKKDQTHAGDNLSNHDSKCKVQSIYSLLGSPSLVVISRPPSIVRQKARCRLRVAGPYLRIILADHTCRSYFQ